MKVKVKVGGSERMNGLSEGGLACLLACLLACSLACN